jgi:hypothetical protein
MAAKKKSKTRKQKLVRVLSIDGGGIRGILPGQIVVRLEEILQTYRADARIADYFDFVAGTSMGGILSCLYLLPDAQQKPRPLLSAKEAVDLYLDRLAPGGLLAAHVSNRFVALVPVLAAHAQERDLVIRVQAHDGVSKESRLAGVTPSEWVLIGRQPEDFKGLLTDPRWSDPPPSATRWTDDHAPLLGSLRLR